MGDASGRVAEPSRPCSARATGRSPSSSAATGSARRWPGPAGAAGRWRRLAAAGALQARAWWPPTACSSGTATPSGSPRPASASPTVRGRTRSCAAGWRRSAAASPPAPRRPGQRQPGERRRLRRAVRGPRLRAVVHAAAGEALDPDAPSCGWPRSAAPRPGPRPPRRRPRAGPAGGPRAVDPAPGAEPGDPAAAVLDPRRRRAGHGRRTGRPGRARTGPDRRGAGCGPRLRGPLAPLLASVRAARPEAHEAHG